MLEMELIMNTGIETRNVPNQDQVLNQDQGEINNQFAQRIIEWYYSKYALNWETFLEAKKIELITNNKSFASSVFQLNLR